MDKSAPQVATGPAVNDVDATMDLIPGTEIMAEFVNHTRLVHAHNQKADLVLVPQPSEDPHDPLNWSKLWKTIVMVNQGLFVLISAFSTLSISPLTPIYVVEWGKTISQVGLLTGVVVLTLGYANFVIIPGADLFGRRPVLIICSLITLGTDIWQALAKSYNSFLAARAISGIGSAANESVMMIVVTDLFFLHERGRFAGVYFWCYFFGTMLGPILAGSIASHVSWRWFFWVCTITQAFNLLSLVFFFPETRRLQYATDTPSPSSPGSEMESKQQEEELTRLETAVTVRDPALGRGTPSRAQMMFNQGLDKRAWSTILHHIVTPVEIFFFPIVFWAAMTTGAAANSLLMVNLTQSQVLAAPPYNFSDASVGYANFALIGGAIFGLTTAGPFSDWLAIRATKKNGGIREAEMRLPAILPYILIAAIGLTVTGVGYQRQWPWEVIIIVGYGMVGVITVALPTIVITYAVDCYKPISGQIMVTATVSKNTFGFGMTYFVNDWAIKSGFIPPLMMMMGLAVGFSLAGFVVFYFWGKSFRRWTRHSKVHSF